MSALPAHTGEPRPDTHALPQQIITLYASINEASYRLLKLIAAFDAASLGFKNGFLTTAHWLSYTLGIGGNAAREKVRVARCLADLPLIDTAFAEGKLSYSKVRALTRLADADNEETLVRIARNASAEQLSRIVRDQLKIKHGRPEVSSKPELSLLPTSQGEWVIKGRLPKQMGAVLKAALDQITDVQTFGPPLDEAALQETEACPDPQPLNERRAFALLDIAEASLKQHSTTGNSAERYVVHIDADDPDLSVASRAQLTCDASVVNHTADSSGEPLNVGRKTRTIPPAIRRALKRRDKGCRFPGCTHSRFVDGHHVQHWSQGGETRLDNLILLCRRHHTMVHEHKARIEVHRPETGAVQFRFYDDRNQPLAATGDACLAHPTKLPDVTAVTPPGRTSPWVPEHPTGRSNYAYIARILAFKLMDTN